MAHGRRAGWIAVLLASVLGLLQPAVAQAANATISGSVKAGGSGVAASIYAYDATTGAYASSADTNSNGAYTLSVPAGAYKLEASPLSTAAPDPGYIRRYYPSVRLLSEAATITVASDEVSVGKDITVQRAAAISGKVTKSAGGAALAGISVIASAYSSGFNGWGSATTLVDGTYVIRGLEPGSYRVQFSGGGYLEQYFPLTNYSGASAVSPAVGATVENVNAVLESGATISGTVKDGAGAAVKNVSVRAVNAAGTATYSTNTGDNGFYSLGALPAGSYTMSFTPENGSSLMPATRATAVSVASGATVSSVDQTLLEGGKITGTVTGSSGPVAGLYVSVFPYTGGGPSFSATTGADGRYTVSGLPQNDYRVSFSGGTIVSTYFGGNDYSSAVKVNSGPGIVRAGIDVSVVRSATITGTIKKPDGTVPTSSEATVGAVWVGDGTPPSGFYGSSTAPDSGKFTISGLAPGKWALRYGGSNTYLTRFYPSEKSSATASQITVGEGETKSGFELTLQAGGSITGKVTDEAGATVTNGVVGLFAESALDSPFAYPTTTRQLNVDGTYTFSGLDSGKYFVGVQRYTSYWSSGGSTFFRGGATTLIDADAVSVSVGAATTGIDLAHPAYAKIRGTIKVPAGHTLDVGSVAAYRVNGDGTTQSDPAASTNLWTEQPTFELGYLLPGRYVLKYAGASESDRLLPVWSGGVASVVDATPIKVSAGQVIEGADGTLRLGGAVSGTVRDAAGNPLDDVWVEIRNSEDSASGLTNESGVYRVSGLPDGRYTARFSAEGRRTIQRTLTLRGGTAPAVDATLTQLPKLSGTVTRPDGTPVSGATVLLYDAGDETYDSAWTSSDGAYSFAGVDPGGHALIVREAASRTLFWDGATGSTDADDLVDLSISADRVINLKLPVGAAIKGVVKTPSGTLGYAGVALLSSNGDLVASTYSSYDGTFSFGGLLDASYRVRASYCCAYKETYNGDVDTLAAAPLIQTSVASPAPVQTITLIPAASGTSPTSPTSPTTPPTSTSPTTPTGVITGKVADDTGKGVAGLSVTLSHASVTGSWAGSAVTAANGTYRITAPAGSYRLQSGGVDASGQRHVYRYHPSSATPADATTVTLAATQTVSNVDLTVPRAASVKGTVVDDAGEPVVGAAITMYSGSASSYTSYTSSSAKGRFSFVGLDPQTVKIRVDAPSNSGLSGRWLDDGDSSETATPIVLGPGQTVTKAATLSSGGAVAGTVRDARGDAVGGASVTLYFDEGYSARSIRAKADGTYRFTGLAKNTYRLRFDPPTDRPDLIGRYSGGAATWNAAASYAVTRASNLTGIDATLPAGAVLRGTVKGGGQPLEGITVSAELADDEAGGSPSSATTDEAGRYELTVPEGAFHVFFRDPAGAWLQQWHGQTAGAGDLIVVDTNVAKATTVDQTLAVSASISGQVLGSAGKVIGSESYTRPNVTAYDADGDWVTSTTASSNTGRFRLTNLPAGSYYLKFTADGYVSESYDDQPSADLGKAVAVGAGEAKGGVNARLDRAGTITGTLTAADGTTVGFGTTVRAYNAAGKVVATGYSSTYEPGKTTYWIGGVPAGPTRIEFDGTDDVSDTLEPFVREFYDGSATLAGAKAVNVVAGQTTTGIDAQLARQTAVPRGKLSGTVSSASGPIGGAWVTVYRANGNEVAEFEAGIDGKYSIDLRPGDYKLRFSSAGYAAEYHQDAASLSTATTITVTSSQTATVNATLAVAPSELSGSVRKPGGAALEGATVSVFASAAAGNAAPVRSVVTNASGSWRVEDLAPGTYKVRFTATGYATQFHAGKTTLADATVLTAVGGKTTAVPEVILQPLPGSIAGTVTAAGGGPITGATVTAYDAETGAVHATATTLGTGTYTLTGLAPGNYKVGFSATGRAPSFNGGATTLAGAASIAVASGQAVTGVDAALAVPPATSGSIAGKVTDAAGTAVSGSTVTLFSGSTQVSAVVTAASGTFRFDALAPAANYALRFEAPGKVTEFHADKASLDAATRLSVTAGATTTADAALATKPVVLKGRVTDVGGALSGVTVTVYAATGSSVVGNPTTTGSAGTFEFERPPGSYRIGFAKAGYGATFYDGAADLAAATVIVAAAGETKDDLDGRLAALASPGTLSGRVLSGGAGLAGATVVLKTSPGGGVVRTLSTDTTGLWTAAGLAAGNYTVEASATGFVSASSAVITLASGATSRGHDLSLTASPTGGGTGGGGTGGGGTGGGGTTGGGTGGGGTTGGGTTGGGTTGGGTTGGGQTTGDGAQPGGGQNTGGGAQPGGDSGGGAQSGGAAIVPNKTTITPPLVAPGAKKVSVGKNGNVSVALTCSSKCTATAALVYQAPKKGKKRPAPVTVGTATVDLSAAGAVIIKLTAKGRKLVAKAGKKGLKVSLLITPAGAKAPSSSTSLTLSSATASKKSAARSGA